MSSSRSIRSVVYPPQGGTQTTLASNLMLMSIFATSVVLSFLAILFMVSIRTPLYSWTSATQSPPPNGPRITLPVTSDGLNQPSGELSMDQVQSQI
ncbi:MAG: putative lysis protein [Alehxovirus allonemorisenecus]|uniref:Lysis protein n=1 Tax=Leviviridae sp. TaxID=2027243 RepID=A0ABY4D5H6_9VIRU|nr:MAG: putative lysis protein [Leviviridae sp.]